jgi:putative membrane protein
MGFHPVYGHYGAGDVLWSIISTALFIGLFVAAIMLLVRVFSGPRQSGVGPAGRSVGAPPWYGSGPGQESGVQPGFAGAGPAWRSPEAEGAERILAERYARGEISEEEYQGRLEVLRRAAPGWAMPQGLYPAQPEPPQPQPRVQPESPAPQPVQPSEGAEG